MKNEYLEIKGEILTKELEFTSLKVGKSIFVFPNDSIISINDIGDIQSLMLKKDTIFHQKINSENQFSNNSLIYENIFRNAEITIGLNDCITDCRCECRCDCSDCDCRCECRCDCSGPGRSNNPSNNFRDEVKEIIF